MNFYIDDGINVNIGWTDHIAFSTNGTDWSTIPKEGLAVEQLFGPGGVGYRYTDMTKIILNNTNSGFRLEFECQDVITGAGTGQHTTWRAGTQASLTIAHEEIMSWL